MDLKLTGKTALIGGGSKGLGKAIALAMAAEGARVAICARGEKDVAATAAEIAALNGGEALGIPANLSKPEAIKEVIAQIEARWGGVDILVVNTGGPRPGKFMDLGEADWDQAYDLLLKSALRLTKAVLPGMVARKWGRVIGVTSISVKEPIESLLLSNVFRAGVTALFKSLSREVAKDGVTVNTLLPGLTDTDRLRGLYSFQAMAAKKPVDEFIAEVAAAQPMQRLNRPEEFAAIATFLAGDGASGLTGCAIQVDGGQFKGLM